MNRNKLPNSPGIWEWFDEDGTKRLVEVVDVASKFVNKPWLRVYWNGEYYNINDESKYCLSEWADRWGNRIADNNGLPKEQLYLGPHQEFKEKILKSKE